MKHRASFPDRMDALTDTTDNGSETRVFVRLSVCIVF